MAYLSMSPATRGNLSQPGFTLVEMIVAAALLIIVSVGSAMLFMLSNRQTLATRERQEQQSAISEDLAAIQRMNDRYSCTGGADACTVASYDPNERQYYPDGSGNDTDFNTLCTDGSLSTNLLSSIDSSARPSSLTRLNITRRDAATVADPEGEPKTHRYTITWVNAEGQQLRQITLVPTVANWCP